MNRRASLLVVLMFTAVASAQRAPFALGEPDVYPPEFAAALKAAAQRVQSDGYDPREFNATVVCDAEACEMGVYPRELDSEQWRGKSYRGCPLKYCASMTYARASGLIVEVSFWR